MAGDLYTAVMVMRMEEGLDTGPIAMEERLAIALDMTAGDLHDALAQRGADLMAQAIAALEHDALTLVPQSKVGVTYATKIDKAETRIDWTQSWKEVHDHARGLSPLPGAWFELPESNGPIRIKVLRTTRSEGSGIPGTVLNHQLAVACGDGAVRIMQLQRAGRQPMTADEFLRGNAVAPGTLLA